MRKLMFFVALAGFVLAQGVLPGSSFEACAADKITLASGAGYKKMVTELAQAFTAQSGIETEQIYGNMGQTLAQAKNSGLVDCVIGDKRFLDASVVRFAAQYEIGQGKLVLAYAKGLEIKDPSDIQRADITRVAMPDPKKAIYGRAADEYLRNSGLSEKIADKLLVVSTVPQVSSYVLSKEVDAGFINLTDAKAIEDKVGGILLVDQAYYSPILIVAGALESAPHADTLKAFAAFLATDRAREIARKHGL